MSSISGTRLKILAILQPEGSKTVDMPAAPPPASVGALEHDYDRSIRQDTAVIEEFAGKGR